MKGVKVPILSVRCLVEDENEVTMDRTGGFIKNSKTGKCIPFQAKNGVYYLTIKLAPPDPNNSDAPMPEGFARPGP